MTFIDRMEADLICACEMQVSPSRSWMLARRRFSGRGTSRRLAIVTAVAAIATPAIAIGVGPVFHDGEGHVVSAADSAPPAEQLALLRILRDPSKRAYVDAETLRLALASEIHGIRTNYIRLLPPAPGFEHQLLYTAVGGNLNPAQFDPSKEAPPTPREEKNRLCVESYEPGGRSYDCFGTGDLMSGRWLESSGLNGYGLVPDGVASVVLHYSDHPPLTEAVTENSFSFQGYPDPGPGEPAGHPGPGATPEPATNIAWLNARGDVISTHRP